MQAACHRSSLLFAAVLFGCSTSAAEPLELELRGRIVDADTGELLPGRLYIRSADGHWHFAQSSSATGSAVEYRKERAAESVEMHTTLSAHPFTARLPAGRYSLVAERGKEYHPSHVTVELSRETKEVVLALRRWVNMSELGWFSGDTHVHRDLAELPNVILAEDLNVALPLSYWVTEAYRPPSQGNKNSGDVEAELIEVDGQHVIYPLNTEYEIFTVGDKRHTLGAVFALNHKRVLRQGVPPVRPIAEQVHREGGLLELDKHNWPWSMMLVPVMDVDLYELTNNHIWRTEFFFRGYGEPAAEYMKIERDERGWTERGWIQFTMENYYTLLNCGFTLRPTAGTASGVHPVPLGFGRVYVHLADGFSYDSWIKGLNSGNSFVTTGPMLDIRINSQLPGSEFQSEQRHNELRVTGLLRSSSPLTTIELVVNGQSRRAIPPANRAGPGGSYETQLDQQIGIDGSGWLALRCFEEPAGRVRFAHTAPCHVRVKDKPLRPRREEVEYLLQRVQGQIARNRGILSEAEIEEYRQALEAYQQKLPAGR